MRSNGSFDKKRPRADQILSSFLRGINLGHVAIFKIGSLKTERRSCNRHLVTIELFCMRCCSTIERTIFAPIDDFQRMDSAAEKIKNLYSSISRKYHPYETDSSADKLADESRAICQSQQLLANTYIVGQVILIVLTDVFHGIV